MRVRQYVVRVHLRAGDGLCSAFVSHFIFDIHFLPISGRTIPQQGRQKCGTSACLSCLLYGKFTVNIVRYILANK